jgi:hypothetical protein
MAIAQVIDLAAFSKRTQELTAPIFPITGNIYRARNGSLVGPLRPFRDEEDSATSDAGNLHRPSCLSGCGYSPSTLSSAMRHQRRQIETNDLLLDVGHITAEKKRRRLAIRPPMDRHLVPTH